MLQRFTSFTATPFRAGYQTGFYRSATLLFIFLFTVAGLMAQSALDREIQEAKSIATDFQRVALFEQEKSTVISQNVRNREPALRDFSVLALNEQAAATVAKRQPLALELALPNPDGAGDLTLDLVRFDLFGADFELIEMPGNKVITDLPQSVFYRGTVSGSEGSLAMISVVDGEISGLVSLPGGSGEFNLVHLEDEGAYLLYNDEQVSDQFTDTSCDALLPKGYTPVDESAVDGQGVEKVSGCLGIYLDIGREVFNERGSVNAANNFIASAFAQVAVLFANEDINITISGSRVWTNTEPFYNDLGRYRQYRANNNVNGSLAHYIHRAGGGGVAYLNTLCNKTYGYGMSGIDNRFSSVPNYSWTVFVLAHEIGHNFSSPHTHACAWNGNNTPIDGCGSGSNGCGTSSFIPNNGGTIMSYCHLKSTGINFSKGFGDQPGNRIRAAASRAGCRNSNCGGGGGGDDDGDDDDDDDDDDNGGGGGGDQILANGVYNIFNRESNKALRAQNGATINGTSVVQFGLRTNWGSQRWELTHLGNDVYRIINPRSNKCLDVSGVSTLDAVNVHIWDYVGGANQQWKIESVGNGYFQLRATHSNKCANIAGNSLDDNGNLIQWPCGSGINDDFRFQLVSSGAAATPDGLPETAVGTAKLNVYPNPAGSTVYLDLDLPEAHSTGEITLSTVEGRLVERLSFDAHAGVNELMLDVSQRTVGVYIIRIQTGDEVMSRRILVKR